jgi:hypothetical protein
MARLKKTQKEKYERIQAGVLVPPETAAEVRKVSEIADWSLSQVVRKAVEAGMPILLERVKAMHQESRAA